MDTNDSTPARHPSVAHFDPLFAWEHLPEHLAKISKPFNDLREDMLGRLFDGPELAAGMRKLLEAKDCFVRQAVLDELSE
jgi:hypothetical protein